MRGCVRACVSSRKGRTDFVMCKPGTLLTEVRCVSEFIFCSPILSTWNSSSRCIIVFGIFVAYMELNKSGGKYS
jgi:hypothetical protein